jgi:hypothetical protein
MIVHVFSKSEEALAERMLTADKANARRGIVRWKYIRGYLHRSEYLPRPGYETTVIDAIRYV